MFTDEVSGGTPAVHIIESLQVLCTTLETVSHKWPKLRDQLDVPQHVMKTESNRSQEDCANKMLSSWLGQATCLSWKVLIDHIDSTKKAPNLVTELQDKYKGKSTTI